MSEYDMNSNYKTCAVIGPLSMTQHHKKLLKESNYKQPQYKQPQYKQKGVVLFFALIALVVMSLAAVALIRSVDTSTIIAGNLAFKQSATTAADSGLETALNWLATNPITLEVDSAANKALGYYATQAADPMTFAWDATDSRVATGYGIVAGTDASGNNIRYVIQRMCRVAGPATPGGCLFGAPVVGTNSLGVKSSTEAGAATSTEQSTMYRITARVTSAKNTISYIQAFVY
jgi:Tfp pilus assembly protein PilX